MTTIQKPRPDCVRSLTYKKRTGCGSLYVTISHPDEEYREIFATLGKTGGCAAAYAQSLTRMITLAVNCGAPLDRVCRQLDGVRCPQDSFHIPSCPQAVAQVITKVWIRKEVDNDVRPAVRPTGVGKDDDGGHIHEAGPESAHP